MSARGCEVPAGDVAEAQRVTAVLQAAALAIACAPLGAAAGVVDARAVESSLLALFAGFVIVAFAGCLALVSAVAGRQRRRLLRRTTAIFAVCAIAAVGYALVVLQSHDFSRLEQTIVFLGASLAVIGVLLVVHAFITGRAAGA